MGVDQDPSAIDPYDAAASPSSGRARVAWAASAIAVYVLALFVTPPRWLDAVWRDYWLYPRWLVRQLVSFIYDVTGLEACSRQARDGGFFVVTALVLPWLVMTLIRRGRPADLGWRRPNRFAWRTVGIAVLVSLPFSLWMVRSPAFAPYYRSQLQAGAAAFLIYYFVVMFGEHFLFHGVMLAAFRADGRWPVPPPVACSGEGGVRRALRWVGLAQPTGGAVGGRRVTRWLGLRDHCGAAILLSALLFGLMHLGKDPREALLSFPGGVFLAYLAYRCDSWLAPFILHLLTAGAACLMMVCADSSLAAR
jgi:hypothetical protein